MTRTSKMIHIFRFRTLKTTIKMTQVVPDDSSIYRKWTRQEGARVKNVCRHHGSHSYVDTGRDTTCSDAVTHALERGLGRIEGIARDLQTGLVKLRESDRHRDAQYADIMTGLVELRDSSWSRDAQYTDIMMAIESLRS
ncbi:hypothetical protein ACOSQ3_005114 [Xanthoceras sorbifolium]